MPQCVLLEHAPTHTSLPQRRQNDRLRVPATWKCTPQVAQWLPRWLWLWLFACARTSALCSTGESGNPTTATACSCSCCCCEPSIPWHHHQRTHVNELPTSNHHPGSASLYKNTLVTSTLEKKKYLSLCLTPFSKCDRLSACLTRTPSFPSTSRAY